jgi:hypothetical protein
LTAALPPEPVSNQSASVRGSAALVVQLVLTNCCAVTVTSGAYHSSCITTHDKQDVLSCAATAVAAILTNTIAIVEKQTLDMP